MSRLAPIEIEPLACIDAPEFTRALTPTLSRPPSLHENIALASRP